MIEATYATDASLFVILANVSCMQAARANSSHLQEVHLFPLTFSGKFITNIQWVFTNTEEKFCWLLFYGVLLFQAKQ